MGNLMGNQLGKVGKKVLFCFPTFPPLRRRGEIGKENLGIPMESVSGKFEMGNSMEPMNSHAPARISGVAAC
jgi:hypothetical protein